MGVSITRCHKEEKGGLVGWGRARAVCMYYGRQQEPTKNRRTPYLGAEPLQQAARDLVGAVVLADLLAQKKRLVVLLHHFGNARVERVTDAHLLEPNGVVKAKSDQAGVLKLTENQAE